MERYKPNSPLGVQKKLKIRVGHFFKYFRNRTFVDRKKEISKKYCRQKGYSLLEILITIAIISLVASIAIPNLTKHVKMANLKEHCQDTAGNIKFLRTDAISKNKNYKVNFIGNNKYIVSECEYKNGELINCNPLSETNIKNVIIANDFEKGIEIVSRGTVLKEGNITIQESSMGYKCNIFINITGKTYITYS